MIVVPCVLVRRPPVGGRGQGDPLDESTAVRYFLETCDALAHCHAKGIVHRDVKGQNVFLTDMECELKLQYFISISVYLIIEWVRNNRV